MKAGRVLLLLLLSSCFSVPALAAPLKVVSNANWYPYMYRSAEGAARGASIKLLERIAGTMNIEVLVEPDKPWARQLAEVQHGQEDLVAGLYRTPERERAYIFSEPYAQEEIRVFVLKGREFDLQQLDDLRKRTGAAGPGGSFGAMFDAFARDNLSLREVRDVKLRLQLLTDRRVDFILFAHADGLAKIHEAGLADQIVALPYVVARNDVCFAFSRRSPAAGLVHRFNEVIRKYRQSGELGRLLMPPQLQP